MIVLVIGSGGREHALALAINHDPEVTEVHLAPGNPGTASFATNHPVDISDHRAVSELSRSINADLVVIGPEAPLVAGLADDLRADGFAVFGPSAAAAQLEGSKSFAKDVMVAAGVPTAAAELCETPEQVEAAMDRFGAPYVIKNDGLAAGKGVVVTDDREVALAHAKECGRVVVEEFLDGPEVSLFIITDGTTVRPLQPAQDFKRKLDGDAGPNTGGMGAYTPLGWLWDGFVYTVIDSVVHPTLEYMRDSGTPFVGLLYVGLAVTSKGPKVVEFNARFGDPETQPLLGLIESPLGQVLHAAATGTLAEVPALQWRKEAAVTVVVAADGYPDQPVKGCPITLPDDEDDAWVIHAGTALDESGQLVSNGGRVLAVVGRGENLQSARERAYGLIERIDFPDGFCRSDIALKAAEGKIQVTPFRRDQKEA